MQALEQIQMFDHWRSTVVKATVENPVVVGDRAAATVTCEFPIERTL